MERLLPYLRLALAFAAGVLLLIFVNEFATVPSPTPRSASTASSTIAVVTATSSPAELLPPAPVVATTTEKRVTPKASAPVEIAKSAPTQVVQAPASVVANTPPPPSGSIDTAAATLRSALVNILCYASAGSGLHGMSGSGVFIDSKGIIITDAHVAQYLLLADRKVSCTIRTGSPAADTYKAALIYISPMWLRANPTVLTQAAPTGTGEYDFALLAVTKSATASTLPALFPSVSLAQVPPTSGTPIVIGSYGAQFLEANQVQSDLFPTVVFGSVKDVYTFNTNTVDVLALGGSVAAQEGSSGGGVVDAMGALTAMITTSTVDGATATRSLSAITASYIRSEYAGEMGTPLDFLLDQPTAASVSAFAPKIPELEAIITANLP